MLRCYGCMAKVTSDIRHVAHTYANPMVVSVLSVKGRAYTMLHQTEWCYSDIGYRFEITDMPTQVVIVIV